MFFIFLKPFSLIPIMSTASQLFTASPTTDEPKWDITSLENLVAASPTEEFIRQKEREARYPTDYPSMGPQYSPPLPEIPKPNENLEEVPYNYSVVLDPQLKTKLYAEILFPVKKIYKKIGDRFEANETLIELDDRILVGNLIKAKAVWRKAQTELQATQSLYDKKVSSEFELKDAAAKEATAYSDLVTATRQLETAKIHVPYAGKVEGVYIEDYELPQTGRELIEVIDDSVLIARLLVPATLLKKISIGQPIKITLENSGEVLQAKIARVGAMIDPASSTVKLEAEINNPDGHIKAGSVGRVTFENPGAP